MWRGSILALALGAGACASVTSPAPRQADSYANFLVGRLADLRSDHAAALDHYSQALERAPGDPALLEGAITAALSSGEIERARQLANQAQQQRASVPMAHLVRAVEALRGSRWRQARDQLGRVRGGPAEELTERMLFTWARVGEGHEEDIAAAPEDNMMSRPYGGLFAYQRALALDYAGQGAEARAAYDLAERGRLWAPPAIERHADLLARSGERDAAIALLRRRDGRQNNPALMDALQRIEAGSSASIYQLTVPRGAAIGLYGLAAVLLQEGASDDAMAVLSLSVMLDDQFDAGRLAFAEAQADLGHTTIARDALARVPSGSSYAGAAKSMEAYVLLREGRSEEALEIARAAVAQDPNPRAVRGLADMYRNLERYGEAEPLYTQLIAQQPDEWRLFFARGVARERLSRWPEAEADLRHALELSPDQPEVLNYLGYTWVDRGENLQEGLHLIQRAVELRPLSGAIVDSLGWAYFRMGDFDQALTYLERAVELAPSDPTLNDHLGDAYWRMGRRIEARFQWRRALGLEPPQDSVPALESKLENGLPDLPRTRSATR